MAKDEDLTQQYPALVIGPPFGGVKEQGPGVYANELAQRGFVVLAFDPSYHGYSGGEPRMTGSTAVYVEDFSAGVDFLGSLDYVDRDRIGAMGICGSGGRISERMRLHGECLIRKSRQRKFRRGWMMLQQSFIPFTEQNEGGIPMPWEM